MPVMACCAPTTSVWMRDMSSPVRVFVKKPSDMRCRWANNWQRRSKMIPSPAWEDHQRWMIPTPAITSGTVTIPIPSQVRAPRLPSGIASSIRRRIRMGGTTESPEMNTTVISTPTSRPR